MQEQLKVCPACGSDELGFGVSESDIENYIEAMIWVECSSCEARGPAYPRYVCGREKAINAWNALPRRLKWTDTPPEKEGFYFIRFGPEKRPFVERISQIDIEGKFWIDGLQWAGPIPLPVDACNKDA